MSNFKEPSFADRQKGGPASEAEISSTSSRPRPALTIPRSSSARPSARRRQPPVPRSGRPAKPPRPRRRRARRKLRAAAAAQLAREKEEEAARQVALEAEAKAKRDARYAARKGGGKGKKK